MIGKAHNIHHSTSVYLSRIPKATLQKLHLDFINPNEWDICYKYNYPYNVLCNFSQSFFVLDNVRINSMEGFLQSLKISDAETQKKVCQLPGFLAKKLGNYLKRNSQYDGVHLYWQGKPIDRYQKEYQLLLNRAYNAKYLSDKEFRQTLDMSKGYVLTHKIGKTSPQETVLTEDEFVNHLDKLRQPKSIFTALQGAVLRVKASVLESAKAPLAVRKLSDLKTTFKNSDLMCGEDIPDRAASFIRTLKQAKVKNIVQINAPVQHQELNKKLCDKVGLNYLCLNFNDKSYDKLANQDLKSLIDLLKNNGLTYICCETRQGSNPVMILNYLFNPKANIADALLFGSPKKKMINHLVSMITKNMTDETKQKLGWGADFGDVLSERKKILQELNS